MAKASATGSGRYPGEADSVGAVLVDNSTYFSAKRLMYEGRLDAYTLFNLANFLECVVVADRIMLAPTLAWDPTEEDLLFQRGGPCSKIRIESWTDEDLGALFDAAIKAGIRNVSSKQIWSNLGYRKEDIGPALALLRRWRSSAENSPREFLEQYSGAVYITDAASKSTVAALSTATDKDASTGYHLAQYVLRANVAFELSSILTYHPHSHRLFYISERMRDANQVSLHLGKELIKATEIQIGHEIETQQRTALLANFGAFKHELRLPLILSAVLSQARTADEVIPIALRLRQTSNARRYRRWVNELIAAVDSNDYERQLAAEGEFESAARNFMRELHELYSLNERRNLLEKTSTYAGTVNPDTISNAMTGDWAGLAAGAATTTVGMLSELQGTLRRRQQRRNFVFLLEMAEQRRKIPSLNPLLGSVFGAVLKDNELTQLHDLQAEQSRGCAAIARLAP